MPGGNEYRAQFRLQTFDPEKWVRIRISDRTIVGHLKTPEGSKTALVPVRVEPDLASRLDKFKVPYTRVIQTTKVRDLMSWVIPSLIFLESGIS